MPTRSYRLTTDSPEVKAAFTELRRQLRVPAEFPDEVLAEAEQAARSPRLPDADETETPFVTLDPAESMDLDQAFHIERRDDGYRVRYAIADVAAFVEAGGPMVWADAQAPGQAGRPAEELLVEPVAEPAYGLSHRDGGRNDVEQLGDG